MLLAEKARLFPPLRSLQQQLGYTKRENATRSRQIKKKVKQQSLIVAQHYG
jgi:hypothetical protein